MSDTLCFGFSPVGNAVRTPLCESAARAFSGRGSVSAKALIALVVIFP
jgi:hypothetical protein